MPRGPPEDMRQVRSARVQWILTLECGHREVRQASVSTEVGGGDLATFRYAVARKRLYHQNHRLRPPAESIVCQQCRADRIREESRTTRVVHLLEHPGSAFGSVTWCNNGGRATAMPAEATCLACLRFSGNRARYEKLRKERPFKMAPVTPR